MATPAQLAKGALRRLALAKQEPTPENFSRAYAEEAGQPATVMPDRARPLLERMAARIFDEAGARSQAVSALLQGRWDQVARLLDGASASGTARGQVWSDLIERLARGLERPARQWTAARKKDSLQRVLDGSRSDAQRLQQRLGALMTAWENDSADDPESADGAAGAASAPEAGPASASAAAPIPAQAGQDWPAALRPLALTLGAALPTAEPRAAELADELGRQADRLASAGALPETVRAIELLCSRAQRLLAHRHHLFDAITGLCSELSEGLTEFSEDESWTHGQATSVQSRLAAGYNARSVRAASAVLAEARARQSQVKAERLAANQALKSLIQQLLAEIGELGAQTGRFGDAVGRHADAIERAESLQGLADVVRELVADSRAVQALVGQTQDRLQQDHSRASELEQQVRALEAELRRLSDEVATDALTQVANRRGLGLAFDAETARAERAVADGDAQAAKLAVALIDIDNFKRLNDSLGHAAGDLALTTLAAAVRERLRPQDTVARFGGEEFVLLLPSTAAEDARISLTRLQRALSESLFLHEGREVFVTFSAGVTAWQPGEALDQALERADEALYEAKRTGKNRTCVG